MAGSDLNQLPLGYEYKRHGSFGSGSFTSSAVPPSSSCLALIRGHMEAKWERPLHAARGAPSTDVAADRDEREGALCFDDANDLLIYAEAARSMLGSTTTATPITAVGSIPVLMHYGRYFTGMRIGVALFLTNTTRNFAGLVVLAFRATT